MSHITEELYDVHTKQGLYKKSIAVVVFHAKLKSGIQVFIMKHSSLLIFSMLWCLVGPRRLGSQKTELSSLDIVLSLPKFWFVKYCNGKEMYLFNDTILYVYVGMNDTLAMHVLNTVSNNIMCIKKSSKCTSIEEDK